MNRRIGWLFAAVIVIVCIVLFSIEESRTFFIALVWRIFLFLKHHIVSLFAAFFLVKGKFIITLFLKKVVFLSMTGLSKRYLIEKVINHHLKIHLFDHIIGDIKRLIVYIKNNFKNFPIVKQLISIFVFLGSLGMVGKFMGWMLAVKVFVAKFWSFLLSLLLKFSAAIAYFFTDYVWNSWIAPIIEVLIFSWLLDLLERIPFLRQYIQKIYRFFLEIFEWFEVYMERYFHIPLKHFFAFLTRAIKRYIYRFIGYNKRSAWQRLAEVRRVKPNAYRLLKERRNRRKEQRRQQQRLSIYKTLKHKRALRQASKK